MRKSLTNPIQNVSFHLSTLRGDNTNGKKRMGEKPKNA